MNFLRILLLLLGIFPLKNFYIYPDEPKLIWDYYGHGNYIEWKPHLDPTKIQTIVEVGSRDAIDSILLGLEYGSKVYSFECNPEALRLCYHNAKHYPFITIVPVACWNTTTTLKFYPVIETKGSVKKNIGGSSLLVSRPDGPEKNHIQGAPISVPGIRLDAWMKNSGINKIDLLCIDAQGSTLQVLEGLGNEIKNVSYIITEVYFTPAFYGEALFEEIFEYLSKNGFNLIDCPKIGPFADVMFYNTLK